MPARSENPKGGGPQNCLEESFGKRVFLVLEVVCLSGIGAGVSSALFLILLEKVTRIQQNYSWMPWMLPVFGAVGVLAFQHLGAGARQGIGLILGNYRDRIAEVPLRMAPLILLSTLLTHLGGGSAGREGTAVQMSVGILSGILKRLGRSHLDSRMMIECGIAAGFGAVFGTPWAGAVFALEMPDRGRIQWRRLPYTTAAAFLGHFVCLLCGARHSDFGFRSSSISWEIGAWSQAILMGLLAGLVARSFVVLTHRIQAGWKRSRIHEVWWAVGAGLVVAVWGGIPGFSAYMGLGVESLDGGPSVMSAFQSGGATSWSWLWKLLFTSLTVASGFRGGEVTPLFFVGATLGNAVAGLLQLPAGYLASLGFVAVFAGASHTPLACAVMAAEIFGLGLFPVAWIAGWISHRLVGDEGIYPNRHPSGPVAQ